MFWIITGAIVVIAVIPSALASRPKRESVYPDPPKAASTVVEDQTWTNAVGHIEQGTELYIRDNRSDEPQYWCKVINPHMEENGVIMMQVIYPSGNVGYLDRKQTLMSPRSLRGGLVIKRSSLH